MTGAYRGSPTGLNVEVLWFQPRWTSCSNFASAMTEARQGDPATVRTSLETVTAILKKLEGWVSEWRSERRLARPALARRRSALTSPEWITAATPTSGPPCAPAESPPARTARGRPPDTARGCPG